MIMERSYGKLNPTAAFSTPGIRRIAERLSSSNVWNAAAS